MSMRRSSNMWGISYTWGIKLEEVLNELDTNYEMEDTHPHTHGDFVDKREGEPSDKLNAIHPHQEEVSAYMFI